MDSSLIGSIITGVLALIGVIIANSSNSKVMAYKIDDLRADMQTKIADVKSDFGDLRERVNKHNNLVERMAKVEASTSSAHKRIDEIKGGH